MFCCCRAGEKFEPHESLYLLNYPMHFSKAKPVVGFSLRVGYSQFVAPRDPRQLWQRTA
jgi:hypothetical protein